jgi:uncharacterized protein (DUF885 family)
MACSSSGLDSKIGKEKMNTIPKTLTRRDFIRLALATGGSVLLSPLMKACGQPVTPTTAATATSMATPVPTAEDLLAGLSGLDIDTFFDKAFTRWLIRDPETLTVLGLANSYGIGNGDLTNISDSFVRETQSLEAGTLNILRTYDRSGFTPAQALNADVYDWFLDDLVRGHPFMYDDYPLNPIVTSIHYNLYMLFTAYHPLNNRQDADDYISRLSQVGNKIVDLIEGLKRRQERGVILPGFIIPSVLSDITQISQGTPSSEPYYTTFSERLTGVSTSDKEALSAQVKEQVNNTVIPAYQELAACLSEQSSHASDTVGVWQFSDGEAYYAQCLRRQTSTDLTADEIHEIGKQYLERIHAEMREKFASLGHEESQSIQELYTLLANDSGSYVGQEAVKAMETTIQEAESFLPQAFDILPRAGVEIVGGQAGNFYQMGSFDGSRPGLFYASVINPIPRYDVKTLIYHETIPGHHLQIAIGMEQTNLIPLRQAASCNAFIEGWALYAERLMSELGAYANDPQGDLGRLRMEAYRAARLVVDTGIHSKRWTFEQAVEYFRQAAGLPPGSGRGEIVRYCVYPGQATSYFIGFLKILELRQKVQDALGSKFDLKDFHRVVLVNGAVPLFILEKLVDNYIKGAA